MKESIIESFIKEFFINKENFFECKNNIDRYTYWSLMHKIERPIQDDFAYFLHKKMSETNIVSIEYSLGNRESADIMILSKKGERKILIELKACFAEDLEEKKIKTKRGYGTKIINDYKKRKKIITDEKYFILIASYHYDMPEKNDIDDSYIVNYSDNMKHSTKLADEKKNYDDFFYTAKNNIKNYKKYSKQLELRDSCSNNIKLGEAFGIKCGLYCFVFKAKK
ncbi:MAG: hypothetical protein FWG89_00020 [Treponema sp.]|nr:hypothetical protein [Treponema sp.]